MWHWLTRHVLPSPLSGSDRLSPASTRGRLSPDVPSTITPVLPVETLLSQGDRARRCRDITERAGVPDEYFAVLYGPALQRFTGYVQQLPLPTATEGAHSPRLLDHTLSVVVAALTLRRGYLLPLGAEPEVIDQQHDVWTYAVFTAALLRNIGQLTEQRVTIYADQKHPAGRWDPWQGPLPVGIHYQLTEILPISSTHYHQITPLLAAAIVPAPGVNWLVSTPGVYTVWLATLMGQAVPSDPLEEILQRAEVAVSREAISPTSVLAPERESLVIHRQSLQQGTNIPGEPVEQNTDPAVSPMSPAPSLGPQFLTWLQTALAQGHLPVNTVNANVHRVPEGILLVSPAIFQAFAITLTDPPPWKVIQKQFQKMKLHRKTAQGENMHGYTIQGSQPGITLNGLLLPEVKTLFSKENIPALTTLLVQGNGIRE